MNGWNFTLRWAPPFFHRDAVDSDVSSSFHFWGSWNSRVTSKDVAFSGCWIWWTILPPYYPQSYYKGKKKMSAFPQQAASDSVVSRVCICTSASVSSVSLCKETRAEVRPDEAPLSPPSVSPPLSPRDEDADSDWWLCPALAPPTPPPPTPPPPLWPLPRHSCAPLLSGPHSPLLAFNAEPGSPLIKVKVSQCLDETEREKKEWGRGRGWHSFWRKTWRK